MREIFFEVHSNLPRAGPGSNESTDRAFKSLKNLPAKPRILDIGCGPGMQTIELAKLSGGQIEALDNHQPFLDQLNLNAKKEGLSDRIKTVNGDMFNLNYAKESFDIIWCEGAIFIIGFEKGLTEWRPLLVNNGYLVLSELWLNKDAPEELKSFMKAMYAEIESSGPKGIDANIEIANSLGFHVLNSFTLPKKDWWDNYYSPIEAKLPSLKAKYRDDPEVLPFFASRFEMEIEMYRKHSDYYGYAFYVLQKM